MNKHSCHTFPSHNQTVSVEWQASEEASLYRVASQCQPEVKNIEKISN